MLENLPKIRLWQLVLVMILVCTVFIGDWMVLMFHSIRAADRDSFIASTVSTVLAHEVPPPGISRSEIEQRFGTGQEAIPGASVKNQPMDKVYPLGWGDELRVSYDYAGVAKTCALFYQDQGVFVQADPASTSTAAYFALTGLVRLQLFLLLLHPYAIIAILVFATIFIITLTPPVQRFLSRNKRDDVPEWMKTTLPDPAKAQSRK